MAQLGRIDIVVQDTAGNGVTGVSVEVRKQGATVNGAQSGTPLTVYDVGALVTGDSVRLNATTSPTRTATVSSGTSIALGGGDLGNVVTGDRITDITLPTIYADSLGSASKANPLTTDSTGTASCYVVGGKYDILISGGGVTTTLKQDFLCGGGENNRCNIYNSGSAVAWILDTLRTLGAGDKILSVQNAGSEKFFVDRQGGFTASQASTITAGGLTVLAGNITNTGSISTTVDITERRLLANQGTNLVNGDFALSAEWGAGATVAVTAGSKDTRGRFAVTAAGVPIANAAASLTFKDGAFGAIPRACATRRDATAPTTGFWTVSESTGGVTFLFVGLPVAGNIYECSYIVMG